MLYRALNKLPMNHNRKHEWLTALANSRRGGWGGWEDLGVVRRPGDFIVGEGCCDPRLPDGVEVVWLYLHYITPSLTVIVATFWSTPVIRTMHDWHRGFRARRGRPGVDEEWPGWVEVRITAKVTA